MLLNYRHTEEQKYVHLDTEEAHSVTDQVQLGTRASWQWWLSTMVASVSLARMGRRTHPWRGNEQGSPWHLCLAVSFRMQDESAAAIPNRILQGWSLGIVLILLQFHFPFGKWNFPRFALLHFLKIYRFETMFLPKSTLHVAVNLPNIHSTVQQSFAST